MDNFDKFYNKAIYFLSFRPRSEKELRDYLKKNKVDDLTSQKIIQSLLENNFLNDEEFAKWFKQQRTHIKPKANRLIKMELKQKGIAEEIISEIFKDEIDTDFEKAKKLAEKRITRYLSIQDKRKVYEKMGRYLASKGFNYDVIKEVIDQVFSKEYNR